MKHSLLTAFALFASFTILEAQEINKGLQDSVSDIHFNPNARMKRIAL